MVLIVWAWGRGSDWVRRMPRKATGIAGIAGLCLLLQALLLAYAGGQGVYRMLREKTALQFEILSTASDQDVSSLYAELSQHPSVADVRFTTREQVYEEQKQSDPEFIAFLERFKLENPFPDTLKVIVRSVDDYRVLQAFLQQDPWRTVVDPEFLGRTAGQEVEIRSLLDILSAARMVMMLLLLCGAVALGLISGRMIPAGRTTNTQALMGADAPLMAAPPFVALLLLLLIGGAIGGVALTLLSIIVAFVTPGAVWSTPLMESVLAHLSARIPFLLLVQAVAAPILAVMAAIVAAKPSVPGPTILSWISLPGTLRK